MPRVFRISSSVLSEDSENSDTESSSNFLPEPTPSLTLQSSHGSIVSLLPSKQLVYLSVELNTYLSRKSLKTTYNDALHYKAV